MKVSSLADMDPSVRASIRGHLFNSVAALSDLLYQEATWGLIDNPYFTYVEFAESFFDWLRDGTDDAFYRGVITARERDSIGPLWTAISDYNAPNNDAYDDFSILADPKWHHVVDVAKKCREELLLLLEPDEAQHLSIDLHRDWSPNKKGGA